MIAANLDVLFPGLEIVETHLVPGDPRRRLRHRGGRGRRSLIGDRGRAAPAALRRGGPPRGRATACRTATATSSSAASASGRTTSTRSRACSTSRALWQLADARPAGPARPALARRSSPPRLMPPDEDEAVDVFAAIRHGDILVHHPYESFAASVRAVHRPGRRRPGRPDDQDDALSHVAATRPSCGT